MTTVIIVIHLMIVLAMIAVILVQRSEGGALGIGGGGGGGGMFSARGSGNLLTRTTTILAIVFFVTSLGLGILAKQDSGAPSILDGAAPTAASPLGDDATRGSGDGLLDTLRIQSGETETPIAPPSTDLAPIDPNALAPTTPIVPGATDVPAVPDIPRVPTNQ
ncbi:MAG: preprotein translocase subunit SecG [Pseudomonadota bacterium]